MKRYCGAFRLSCRVMKGAYGPLTEAIKGNPLSTVILSLGVSSIILSLFLCPVSRDIDKMLLQDLELMTRLEESRYQLSGSLATLLTAFSTQSMSQLAFYLLTTIVLLLFQVAFTIYLITTPTPLSGDAKTKIHMISETQKYLESYCKHLEHHCQTLEEDLCSDIDSLKKHLDDKATPASEKYSESLGMLWNEAYKIRKDIISLSMSLSPSGSSMAKNDLLRETISNYSEPCVAPRTSDRYIAPSGASQRGQWPKLRPKSILRTEYGAFDLGTKEGRERWKMSVELARGGVREENRENSRLNMAKKDGAIRGEPSQLLAPVPEHAGFRPAQTSSQLSPVNPEFSFVKRPTPLSENDTTPVKGTNGKCETTISVSTASHMKLSPKSQAPIPLEKSIQLSCSNKLPSPGPVPVPVLTSADLKAKLEEGEKKQYRRLFIPGRGWMSTKRLQEEKQMLEEAEKREVASQNQ